MPQKIFSRSIPVLDFPAKERQGRGHLRATKMIRGPEHLLYEKKAERTGNVDLREEKTERR